VRSSVEADSPGAAWLTVSAGLVAGSVIGWFVPAALWDWQPELAWQQPWRWWTAAFVHWSPLHAAANLGAALLVMLFGQVARVPMRVAGAWLLAWPLTHLGLLAAPGLLHYGGLSGVLHAGVAAVIVFLVLRAPGRRRRIALALGTGLLFKLGFEAPWGAPLRQAPGWDIAVVPLAHATGTLAGALCALALLIRRPAAPSPPPAPRR